MGEKRWVWLQRISTKEYCGDGTIKYLDCGDSYRKLYM